MANLTDRDVEDAVISSPTLEERLDAWLDCAERFLLFYFVPAMILCGLAAGAWSLANPVDLVSR